MSFDFHELTQFRERLDALKNDIPEIMSQLVIGEGVYAVKQARSICTEDGFVNNGTYRMNFHAGNKALMDPGRKMHDGSPVQRNGTNYKIDVYNNLDYAKALGVWFSFPLRSRLLVRAYLCVSAGISWRHVCWPI